MFGQRLFLVWSESGLVPIWSSRSSSYWPNNMLQFLLFENDRTDLKCHLKPIWRFLLSLIYCFGCHNKDIFDCFTGGNFLIEHLEFRRYTVFENHRKKSHSTLRAKRATFTFWVDKSSLKTPKMLNFGEVLKTRSLQSNSVTRQVTFNRTKNGGKCQNSNATFWVIFKQCELDKYFVLKKLHMSHVQNIQ